MENTDHENSPNPANDSKKLKQLLLISGCVVMLCVPLLILIFKHTAKMHPTAQATGNNIATLEAQVSANPNFANLVNLSAAYIKANAPGAAIPCLKKALKIDSTNAVVYNNLGVANIMLKNLKQGIAACTKAVALDGKFELAKNNLKWGLSERSKDLAAIDQLQSTPPEKKDIKFYTQLGLYYLYVGDYASSLTTWQQGLAIDSKNTILLNDIGTALVMEGNYDEAIVSFNKILAADPNNQLAKNNIAWALNEKSGN